MGYVRTNAQQLGCKNISALMDYCRMQAALTYVISPHPKSLVSINPQPNNALTLIHPGVGSKPTFEMVNAWPKCSRPFM